MIQNIYFMLIVGIILIFSANEVKSDEAVSDEYIMRNKLVADIFLLKEGVDRLQISVDVLDKRYSNQIDVLKEVQTNINHGDKDDDNICDKMGGYFNSTFKKYNVFESRIVSKLTEIQDGQTARLNEILVKQNLNKNCGSQADSSSTLSSLISAVLLEINEKIDKFEEQLQKLETMEETLSSQQSKKEQFDQEFVTLAKEINEKLIRNQEKFKKLETDLPNVKELAKKMNEFTNKKYPKLQMEMLLGITNANATKKK